MALSLHKDAVQVLDFLVQTQRPKSVHCSMQNKFAYVKLQNLGKTVDMVVLVNEFSLFPSPLLRSV